MEQSDKSLGNTQTTSSLGLLSLVYNYMCTIIMYEFLAHKDKMRMWKRCAKRRNVNISNSEHS